jgi:large subunit ribosomal protein L32e
MAKNDKPAKVRPVKVQKAAAPSEAKAKVDAKADAEAARKAKEVALEEGAEEEDEEGAREGEPAKAPAKEAKKAPQAKAKPKGDDDEEEGEEEGDDDDDEAPAAKKGKSKPRPRPRLSAELKEALAQRKVKNAKRPEFHRQEWFRYQRLGTKWRFPQGIQSKMRRHWKTHADVVSIGHRGPKAARGLHPSGFREVMVHNAEGLKGVDPALEAVRIASSVGRRKREEIQNGARKLGIRVLNWRNY